MRFTSFGTSYVFFVSKKLRWYVMGSQEILEQALRLKPDERFTLVEGLLRSLDEPDKQLDALWADEAEKRLKAYRQGHLEAIPMEDIFRDET